MPCAARGSSPLFATLALAIALSGCGGSSGAGAGAGAGAPSDPGVTGPIAAIGVTDGRTGPAVTATESGAVRELAPGGRADPSDPRRSGDRSEGIGAGDACPQPDLAPVAGNLDEIDATTLCLLNGVRADDGLRPLKPNAELARAARAHSEDMVARSYFAHEGRSGSEVKDRIGATGYLPKNTVWTIGENLAWGTGALATPKAIVNAWMNSKGHRDNILKAEYRDIGFGTVAGNPASSDGAGATYVTEFGVRGVPAGTAPASSRTAAARNKAQRARRARAKRASARRASALRATVRSAARP